MTTPLNPKQISRFRNVSIRWLIVSVLASLIFVCGGYLLYPSFRARYLFHELGSLQVGHSSFEDAQWLAKKLGAKPNGIGLRPCDRSYCFWIADVSNARLPQWWRGSGVTFVLNFEAEDSVVVYKGAGYVIGIDTSRRAPSEVWVGVKEQWLRTRRGDRLIMEQPTTKGWGMSYFERNGHREDVSTKFQVHMTPRSSAEDWRRYSAFNYSCFWKYKGCRDGRELLPTADPFPSDKRDPWPS